MIWEGHHHSVMGMGEAARQYVMALDDLGVAVTPRLVEWTDDRYLLRPEVVTRLEQLSHRDPEAGEVHVQHLLPPSFRIEADAGVSVGCTTFDADGIPQHWVACCNHMDEVWVPSQFCLRAFASSGVNESKLRVIPHGVDTRRFAPHVRPVQLGAEGRFTFLAVCDWTQRKGWDVLVRAYLSEFSADDDVALVIRAAGIVSSDLTELIAKEFGPGPRPLLVVIPFAVREDLMPRVYAGADAFVLPSRGEGWGLPYSEAMATGLPTIATRWGGHLDYMGDDNAYLVDVAAMVPIDRRLEQEIGAEPGLQQAEPSVEHLGQMMRRVYEHPEEAKAKGRAARRAMVQQRTWRQAAARVWERAAALTGFELPPLSMIAARVAGPDSGTVPALGAPGLTADVLKRVAELGDAESLADAVLSELRQQLPKAAKRQPRRKSRGR